MENTAFEADAEKGGVELTNVKIIDNPSVPHSCQPDVCRSLHAKYLQDKHKMAASPWDRLKTVFLVGIIALLALWLMVYVASSRMGFV